MGKLKSYAVGAAIGGVIGSVAVLLSTPKSGSEMRSDLKTKADDAKEPLKDFKSSFGGLRQQIKTIKNDGVPAIKSTVSDVAELVKTFQKEIQPHIKQIKQDVNELEKTKERLEANTNEPSSK
ncbi:gas vesicle protein [Scopulibacillus darangshiensis]|uniref:Gas vesicle protein n=1 Tax=Scopulibacillus darangshiensis TaxID=442528 RepID=A0A4V2SN15_9BACL|nr:YtxH domain-containing protein [Scopulibacillus darangshiensis]TCP29276.1 gas vesicle protein [Scopulibacillus darangshiensis]